jgi:hypothetical protein
MKPGGREARGEPGPQIDRVRLSTEKGGPRQCKAGIVIEWPAGSDTYVHGL